MGQFLKSAHASAFATAAVLAAFVGVADGAHAAKSKAATGGQAAPAGAGGEAAQKQKAQAAAKTAFDSGIKSYQAGKYEPAVQSFSEAIRQGGLPSNDLAHALYYRGLSYKKQSKPGLAISDLTSALWLKNGLSDSEKKSATAERAEAYKLAGLGDGNSGAETVAVADPNPPAAGAKAANAAAAAAPAPAAAPATGQPARAARTVEAPQQIGTIQAVAAESALVNDGPRTSAAAAAGAAAPQFSDAGAAPATTGAGPSGTVSGFFSNLFGGGTPAPPAAAAPPQITASTTAASPQTSSWTADSKAATGEKPGKAAKTVKTAALAVAPAAASPAAAPAQVAAAAPEAGPAQSAPAARTAAGPAAQPAPQVKGGKYKVHIAAVRSRAEAEALAQKLVQQHGAVLMSRTPTVDEAVIGSMGTFYRVRVGSFANADEPRGLCNTLRTSGYDCLVVTN